ncbi:MAG: PA14 domain-containing protein [Bryobacteraceae bacterium]
MRRLFASSFAVLAATAALAQEYRFGTTIVSTSALQGKVYLLRPGTYLLPDFDKMRTEGSVYTNTLNIWPQDFREGFPGVTSRYEWFGIDYSGKFWVEEAGQYRFSLLADDGAKLWIDNRQVIDLDGIHSATSVSGSAHLTRGVHRIRVAYFQGPQFIVALVLAVAKPGGPWKIFHTDDFMPPKDPAEWVNGKIKDVKPLENNPKN